MPDTKTQKTTCRRVGFSPPPTPLPPHHHHATTHAGRPSAHHQHCFRPHHHPATPHAGRPSAHHTPPPPRHHPDTTPHAGRPSARPPKPPPACGRKYREAAGEGKKTIPTGRPSTCPKACLYPPHNTPHPLGNPHKNNTAPRHQSQKNHKKNDSTCKPQPHTLKCPAASKYGYGKISST